MWLQGSFCQTPMEQAALAFLPSAKTAEDVRETVTGDRHTRRVPLAVLMSKPRLLCTRPVCWRCQASPQCPPFHTAMQTWEKLHALYAPVSRAEAQLSEVLALCASDA